MTLVQKGHRAYRSECDAYCSVFTDGSPEIIPELAQLREANQRLKFEHHNMLSEIDNLLEAADDIYWTPERGQEADSPGGVSNSAQLLSMDVEDLLAEAECMIAVDLDCDDRRLHRPWNPFDLDMPLILGEAATGLKSKPMLPQPRRPLEAKPASG